MAKCEDFANDPNDPIYLSGHLTTYLRRDGVSSLEDLLKLTEGHILRIPGVGTKGLREIREALGILGGSTLGEMRARARGKPK